MKHTLSALALSLILLSPAYAADKVAYFAGGCFWCTEADFEKMDGVGDVISGFMGGKKANPSYQDVAYGRTTHREAVKVPYDDSKVSYQQLLSAFWRMHDPTDGTGSFVDRGRHYSSAIYYVDDTQKRLAEGAIAALEKSGKFQRPITTEVAKATGFYKAEEYHQDYYKKAATKYKFYRFRSGRDQFIKANWKDDATVYQLAQR
ncbi:MAG: peptide-methionine (S)-S-oxide reductase MsrA [Alphaproteobacteria bacterium]|nr:peptide-methionine (S)-S-oxide reductase MsrA [Alphaproteobacteria bacterium]